MFKILGSIVDKIKHPLLLYLLGYAIIVYLMGVYDFEKLVQIKDLLTIIFTIGAILFIIDGLLKYKGGQTLPEKEKIIKELNNKISCMEKEKQALLKELKQRVPLVKVNKGLDAYSISLDLETHDNLVDKENHYTKLVYYAEINEEGTYNGVYERYGNRIVNGLTKFLLIQTGASFPIGYKDLKLEAYDIKTGKKLEDEVVDDSSKYKKIYKIYLDPAAKKLEPFSVRWKFTWPCCVAGKYDSDTINLKVFRKGTVDELTHTIVFPFNVGRVLLQEVTGNEIRDSDIQPLSPEEKDGKFYYSYTIKNPKVDGYVISWVRP